MQAEMKRLGIVVGGGPAPGINAVISAATIQAINMGFTVIGFYDGFKWLASDRFDAPVHATRLDINGVARIHFDGGSILRISRTNLLDEESLKTSPVVRPDPEKVRRVIANLRELGVGYLLVIGGDDTALSGRFIGEAAGKAIKVVAVPKTIDNDLPLPHNLSTFGFSTARYIGTGLVKNLMRDSQTTGRWYLVTCMGRRAGSLALSIGQSAGATLTLIPEEFPDHTTVQQIADVLEGSMLKRSVMGRPDGVALIAEGLAYKLGDRAELERLLGREVPMDAAGHPRLAEVPLGEMLRKEIERRFKARAEKISMVTHMLGYELRSADPTPHDMGYCRSLGYHSIRLFTDGQMPEDGAVLVTLVNGNLRPMPLKELIDPATNRIRTRQVDIRSDVYEVARAYMIRLERRDIESPDMVGKLAAAAKLPVNEFRQRYLRAALRLWELDEAGAAASIIAPPGSPKQAVA